MNRTIPIRIVGKLNYPRIRSSIRNKHLYPRNIDIDNVAIIVMYDHYKEFKMSGITSNKDLEDLTISLINICETSTPAKFIYELMHVSKNKDLIQKYKEVQYV